MQALRHTFGTLALLAALPAAAAAAQAAEKFPSRPITMINPFPPGGAIDVTTRALSVHMERTLGQPIVIDYKPGAGATLGPAAMVAAGKPDGYTISNFSVGIYSIPWMQKVTFDPARDFTYIIQLNGYRGQFVVRPDSKWHTFKEFLADARANPGKFTYASSGTGGSPHLNMEALSIAAGFKLRHVPFRGNSEVIAALLGGHVDLLGSSATIVPLVVSGELRSLLVTMPVRNPRFPDIPSLADEGIKPITDPSNPFGWGGPKGMPPAVVAILHDAIKAAFDTEDYKKAMASLDLQDRYLNSADYTAYAMQQIEAYGNLVKRLGLARN